MTTLRKITHIGHHSSDSINTKKVKLNHKKRRRKSNIKEPYQETNFSNFPLLISLHGVHQDCRSEMPLVVAVQVISIANLKKVTVPLVETNAIFHLFVPSLTAFKSAIDDVRDDTITRSSTSCLIGSRGTPSASNHIVA